MNEAQRKLLDKPVLTLKHGMQRDSSVRPKPIQILTRKHSRVACTVFVKHSHGLRDHTAS